ncbi:MAG: DUF1934 domain-containing protein [Clostridia bacterium]|nr:DUF1934 domain-containing protein [Clostridia bacterium]
MKNQIRLKIKSIRYESEVSLFSMGEDVAIEDGQIRMEVEPETMEICSVGVCSEENGRRVFSYDETEATGMDGSTTSVTYLLDRPELVTMLRKGSVSTALVFEEGKRHHCVYQTPFMPFEVCVHTLKVENRLETERTLALDYIIEIRGARAERTKFFMEIY